MTSLAEKERKIEAVRYQLHRLVENKFGKFSDREVTELSTYLDELIVDYELARSGHSAQAVLTKSGKKN